MPALCCPECFGDHHLRNDRFPAFSGKVGTCSFCKSNGVRVVDPKNLSDVFQVLASSYQPDSTGKPLFDWLVNDWLLFPDPPLSSSKASQLLAAILDEKSVGEKLVSPVEQKYEGPLASWDDLKRELMYSNRYFFNKSLLDVDRLTELLSHLVSNDLPNEWYRARMTIDVQPYPLDKMGAPPNRLVSHGRANPPGIPYLYLGSTPNTAISEIRPHTGEHACVAKFELGKKIAAVDLRQPRKKVSPFILADTHAVSQLRADIPFLERLGEELTRPVIPSGAAIDYVPSQFLCEFIKNAGYAGVAYPSSVSSGFNLALFQPELAIPISTEMYAVTEVAVSASGFTPPPSSAPQ